jgi:hypothetical protein
MLYMVETSATIEKGDTIDSGAGPGPFFAKIADRFRPQAIYGNPTRRQIFMVVELGSPADVAELMYALTWFTGNEPKFTPIMPPETYMEAISKAKKIVEPVPPRS